MLPIPISTIGSASLEGTNQRNVAAGRLGQSNGYRAVKVQTGKRVDTRSEGQNSFNNVLAKSKPLPVPADQNPAAIGAKAAGLEAGSPPTQSEDTDGVPIE